MPLPTKSTAKRPRSGPSGSPEPPAPAPGGPVGGEIFLMLPGLNLAPAKLQPLAMFLAGLGHQVARPALRGFGPGEEQAWAGVSAADWLEDVDRAWADLSNCHPGAVPSLVGYSMGALLGLTWSLSRGIPLRRAVLISPALQLKWYLPPALRVLGAVLPGSLRLPSKGPSPYLARRGTSLAAYGAMAALLRDFRRELARRPPGGAGLPPQFLAYSPRDELISTGYLARYRSRCQAVAGAPVAVHVLGHRPRAGCPYHLGIDAHTLGDSEWAAFAAALEGWLAR